MTTFGWDASNWDWTRKSLDLVAAKNDGISFFTHRATSGTLYQDPNFGLAMQRAKDAGIPVLGAYIVVRTPGNNGHGRIEDQVKYFLNYVNATAPWWTTFPYWFWQVDTEKWSNTNGVYDAVDPKLGANVCLLLRERTNKQVIHYAPKWAYGDTIPGTDPLWASNYGANPITNFKSAYVGDNSPGWTSYSNRVPTILQFGSKTIIGSQETCDANAFRGTLEQLQHLIKGGEVSTYAPQDLLNVRAYVMSKTGLTAAESGIIGDSAHYGGYHHGWSMRVQPSDYSWNESPFDLNHQTEAASAFDLGGNFSRFREITLDLVAACQRGDNRARDIREIIYTPDGLTVKRWDRLGIRSTGDDSHLFHTHVSFFRQSEGFRDKDDNFLGLIREAFEGKQSAAVEEDDDMGASFGPIEIKKDEGTSLNIPPVAAGAADPRLAWLNICNDTNGVDYALRIWWSTGDGGWAQLPPDSGGVVKFKSGFRASYSIPTGCSVLTISRQAVNGTTYNGHLTCCIERGPVIK